MPKWIVLSLLLLVAEPCRGSDHLDTRTVIEDPRADIGDLYAWMSPDGERLELAMTIVGHEFSPDLAYAFHVDSGEGFGKTTASLDIVCRVPAVGRVECRGGAVQVEGDAGGTAGIASEDGRLRVFAGLRDDPFFNNVKGARDAYQVAAAAMKRGAAVDADRCPALDPDTSKALLDAWRHTDGGPAQDFLHGWTPASLVVSVARDVVDDGGPVLAVWATVSTAQRQLDRMGRPLTGNALLAPLAADEVSDALKAQYNGGSREQWPALTGEIQKTLGLYDGFDGVCGNQWLADATSPPGARYRRLAEVLADDRLWVDTTSGRCERFMAVELAALGSNAETRGDCGGRTPTQDAVDVYRSLLANGSMRGVDDGVERDARVHSTVAFPFLAPVQDDRQGGGQCATCSATSASRLPQASPSSSSPPSASAHMPSSNVRWTSPCASQTRIISVASGSPSICRGVASERIGMASLLGSPMLRPPAPARPPRGAHARRAIATSPVALITKVYGNAIHSMRP